MRVIVVGSGPGGASFAGTLAAAGRHEIVLLEAGPDYGPFSALRWPFELLDSRRIPPTHDWGLINSDPGSPRRYPLERAKVLGGCSSHNGCSAVRGLAADYRGWAQLLGPADGKFWAPEALIEDFAAVEAALEVRRYEPDEVTPFQRAVEEAALALGLPLSADINDLEEGSGVSLCPVNKRGGVRWNAAFAFLDPVRDGGRLEIRGDFEAETLVIDKGRAVGVRGRQDGRPESVEGDCVVLAAGAYGSPMLLMRSGIGDPALLEPASLEVCHALSGVGRNLQDHPAANLSYRASSALLREMQAFERRSLAYDEGIIVKVRSSRAAHPVDLHIYACGGRSEHSEDGWYWQLCVALLTARSRGLVRPLRQDGELTFVIEHRHASDAAGEDAAVLIEGVALAREIAATAPLDRLLTEVEPGPDTDEELLRRWILEQHLHYFHPAGTCALGRDPEAGAVVDGLGRVQGLAGLMVADASIMPVVTAGNTNVPTAMIGRRLARHFDEIAAAWKTRA